MKNRRLSLHILLFLLISLAALATVPALVPALCACPLDADCGAGCTPFECHDEDPGCASCSFSTPVVAFALDTARTASPAVAAPPFAAHRIDTTRTGAHFSVPDATSGEASPPYNPPLRI